MYQGNIMKDFFKKYKIYIVTGICVVLVGNFFYWGICRLIKDIKFNADEMQRKIIDSEINEKKLAKIPQIQKTSGELVENDKKLTGILKEEDEVDFIKKIDTLAEETKNKIDLKIIDDGQKEKDKVSTKTKNKTEPNIKLPESNYISLQANLTGNYSSLYNFIKRLESFEYYVNIVSISISVEEDKSVKERAISNPFVGLSRSNQSSLTPVAEPKFVLKSQVNFIVYIKPNTEK